VGKVRSLQSLQSSWTATALFFFAMGKWRFHPEKIGISWDTSLIYAKVYGVLGVDTGGGLEFQEA